MVVVEVAVVVMVVVLVDVTRVLTRGGPAVIVCRLPNAVAVTMNVSKKTKRRHRMVKSSLLL